MTNLDSIVKSRDITLSTKVHLVKAMVLPVVVYGCERWTIKKAEHRRIDAFELWCWRRLSRVPWTARRSNQSILKEISPEYSLEGLMLKLKLQYFGHLMRRATYLKRPWFWKRLKTGGEGDDRGWDGWMASLTQWTWVWVNSGVGDGQGCLARCSQWCRKELDIPEWLNWTEIDHQGNPISEFFKAKERLCCTVDIFNIQKILKAGGQLVKFSPWLPVFPQCDGFRGLQGYLFFCFFFSAFARLSWVPSLWFSVGRDDNPFSPYSNPENPPMWGGKGESGGGGGGCHGMIIHGREFMVQGIFPKITLQNSQPFTKKGESFQQLLIYWTASLGSFSSMQPG